MRDVYKNIEEYNIGKKLKILIVFDELIADMINNKKLNPVATKLFIRGRKLNILIFFNRQSHFLIIIISAKRNSPHFFIIEIPNKTEILTFIPNKLD